jgi:DNA-directed RNA polymerase specialized sigma24 family protein
MGLPQRRGLGNWRTDLTLSLDRVHRQNECADRLRAGDPAALEELLDEYWEPIVRYVTRLLDDRDAGHDVAQMTFVRLWQIRSTLVPT